MVLNIRKPAVFKNNFPDSIIHPIIIPQISLDETKLLTPTGPFCLETGNIFFQEIVMCVWLTFPIHDYKLIIDKFSRIDQFFISSFSSKITFLAS